MQRAIPHESIEQAGRFQKIDNGSSAQRFLSAHAVTYNTFNVQRHLTSARTHRAFWTSAIQTWHRRGVIQLWNPTKPHPIFNNENAS
jgi:hypothetical protein